VLEREGTGGVVGTCMPSQRNVMKGSFSNVPCSNVEQTFVVVVKTL